MKIIILSLFMGIMAPALWATEDSFEDINNPEQNLRESMKKIPPYRIENFGDFMENLFDQITEDQQIIKDQDDREWVVKNPQVLMSSLGKSCDKKGKSLKDAVADINIDWNKKDCFSFLVEHTKRQFRVEKDENKLLHLCAKYQATGKAYARGTKATHKDISFDIPFILTYTPKAQIRGLNYYKKKFDDHKDADAAYSLGLLYELHNISPAETKEEDAAMYYYHAYKAYKAEGKEDKANHAETKLDAIVCGPSGWKFARLLQNGEGGVEKDKKAFHYLERNVIHQSENPHRNLSHVEAISLRSHFCKNGIGTEKNELLAKRYSEMADREHKQLSYYLEKPKKLFIPFHLKLQQS